MHFGVLLTLSTFSHTLTTQVSRASELNQIISVQYRALGKDELLLLKCSPTRVFFLMCALSVATPHPLVGEGRHFFFRTGPELELN